jgi:hypothetical protein
MPVKGVWLEAETSSAPRHAKVVTASAAVNLSGLNIFFTSPFSPALPSLY